MPVAVDVERQCREWPIAAMKTKPSTDISQGLG